MPPQKELLEQQFPHCEPRQVRSEPQEPVVEVVRFVAARTKGGRRAVARRQRSECMYIVRDMRMS